MATTGEFYEDDEPVEDVLAAFDAGQKVVTGKRSGWTSYLRLPAVWNQVGVRSSEPSTGGAPVHLSPAH